MIVSFFKKTLPCLAFSKLCPWFFATVTFPWSRPWNSWHCHTFPIFLANLILKTVLWCTYSSLHIYFRLVLAFTDFTLKSIAKWYSSPILSLNFWFLILANFVINSILCSTFGLWNYGNLAPWHSWSPSRRYWTCFDLPHDLIIREICHRKNLHCSDP